SAEVVRQAAKDHFNRKQVGPDTPLNVEKLAKALPAGILFEQTETGARITLAGKDAVTLRLVDNITNEQTKGIIEEYLNAYLVSLNIKDIDLIRERQVDVNKTLERGDLEYWERAIREIEQAFLVKT